MNKLAVQTYKSILLEIRLRVEAIYEFLNGRVRLRQRIGVELCYLQLRMICELIAIGCLILHEDVEIKRKKDLLKTYKADWIIKSLGEIHGKFFPRPVNAVRLPSGRDDIQDVKSGFLTRDELVTLFNRTSGNELHRGCASDIMTKNLNTDIARLRKLADKVSVLVAHHVILSRDEKIMARFWIPLEAPGTACGLLYEMQPDGNGRGHSPEKIVTSSA